VAAALTLPDCNGVSTEFDSMPLCEAMTAIAEKRMEKADLATVLRALVGA
jgi:hypothetical protein